jgi:cytochrome c biogenesis protein CcmG/thiol:disulfide interchange protein DsbE
VSRIALLLLPLVLLVGLITVFAFSMNRDPSLVRSVLIDKPAPDITLPAVAGLGVNGLANPMLEGQAVVVNVFASWCVPCRAEHPFLMEILRQTAVPILGINQKDAAENAVKFLTDLGNPYSAVGADTDGRVSIDWGVYGVPETFVVNPAGLITYKHVGPIDAASLDEVIAAVQKAKTDFRSAATPGAISQ